MKILFLSDTHGVHRQLENLPMADLIIHGGDVSKRGRIEETEDFIDWFTNLDYQYKIFIAGNHDFYFEGKLQHLIQNSLKNNTYYLCNSGVTIEGINIWGSPVTPTFFDWAFNVDRGNDILKYWQQIPENTDILITHGPPFGILDQTNRNENVGCQDLLDIINEIKSKYHLFGHIHEGYGTTQTEDTVFINGSLLDEDYRIKNTPFVFDL